MGLLMRCLILPIADSRENAMILGRLLPCEYGAKQIILSKRKNMTI